MGGKDIAAVANPMYPSWCHVGGSVGIGENLCVENTARGIRVAGRRGGIYHHIVALSLTETYFFR